MPPPIKGCCAHSHDCEAEDCGPAWSLYKHIDIDKVCFESSISCSNALPSPLAIHHTPLPLYLKLKSQVRCLNEDVHGSVRSVFKPWNDRLNPSEITLKSDPDDSELLIHIPFDGMVKLRAICIIGGTNDSSPSKLRVFTNRDDLDFAAVENGAPVQEWDLNENFNGEIEYPTTVSKFNGVYSIDLHIPASFGASFTEVTFIGLKGEWESRRREAVQAIYESRAMPKDHKVPEEQGAGWKM